MEEVGRVSVVEVAWSAMSVGMVISVVDPVEKKMELCSTNVSNSHSGA